MYGEGMEVKGKGRSKGQGGEGKGNGEGKGRVGEGRSMPTQLIFGYAACGLKTSFPTLFCSFSCRSGPFS